MDRSCYESNLIDSASITINYQANNTLTNFLFVEQFLMRLQSKDYIAANQIQQELSRMMPGDPTIQAFASYLPAEAEWQEAVL